MAVEMAIADQIQSALATFAKQPKDKIKLRHSLRFDLGLDSVDTIELIFLLEGKFNFEFSDADMQQLVTVSDVVTCVEHRLTSRA